MFLTFQQWNHFSPFQMHPTDTGDDKHLTDAYRIRPLRNNFRWGIISSLFSRCTRNRLVVSSVSAMGYNCVPFQCAPDEEDAFQLFANHRDWSDRQRDLSLAYQFLFHGLLWGSVTSCFAYFKAYFLLDPLLGLLNTSLTSKLTWSTSTVLGLLSTPSISRLTFSFIYF